MSNDFEEEFDKLVKLFKEDPAAFEEHRTKLINEAIEQISEVSPEKGELVKRFQWRLDRDLNQCNDSTERYNQAIRMFWEQVGKFQHVLKHGELLDQKKADVLPFRSKDK